MAEPDRRAAPPPSDPPGGQQLLFLSRDDVSRLLDLDELRRALGDAFKELSEGRASVPARVGATTPSGILVAMPGYVPARGLAAKLVAVFPANQAAGLPTHLGLVALFDETTGSPLAVMDGAHITAVRTAAASALAAELLARPESAVLAILGAGVQGEAHLRALSRVLAFHEVRVASRTLDHARALASTDPRARAMRSIEEAVRGADVVCCCTDAAEPILSASWLAPGAHVISVGFRQGGAGELDAETVRSGALFVESRVAFEPPPAGCPELRGMDPSQASELGEVLSGRAPGRRSGEQVTVYKSMGHAVEDVAAAHLAYARAVAGGAGVCVRLT
jgi:alanine dehydrogenase